MLLLNLHSTLLPSAEITGRHHHAPAERVSWLQLVEMRKHDYGWAPSLGGGFWTGWEWRQQARHSSSSRQDFTILFYYSKLLLFTLPLAVHTIWWAASSPHAIAEWEFVVGFTPLMTFWASGWTDTSCLPTVTSYKEVGKVITLSWVVKTGSGGMRHVLGSQLSKDSATGFTIACICDPWYPLNRCTWVSHNKNFFHRLTN